MVNSSSLGPQAPVNASGAPSVLVAVGGARRLRPERSDRRDTLRRSSMRGEWVFFPCFFGMISFVIWVVVNGWLRRQHVRLIVEFNNRVLEKLGSMREFSDFLHS